MRTLNHRPLHRSQPATDPHVRPSAPAGIRWTALGSILAVLASLFGGIVFAAPAQAVANTIVTLTFDDGNADQFAAAATLKAAGLRGTFFVPSGYLNAPTYMTTAQVQALQADGHEIAGHTVTHPDLVAMGPDEAKRQICNDRVNLTGWGLNITNFAYPFASSSPAVETIVKDCGYNSARGLGDILSKAPDSIGMPVAETIPPLNPYNTAAPNQVDNTWTLADLQNQVTQAVTGGGGWVQLTFHHIGTPATDPLTITEALYGQYVTWLKDQAAAGTIEVKTVRDVIGGTSQPVVSGPAAPAPITTGNLIQNPSLETAGPVVGLPKCWATGAYGTNTPTFAPATPGHTGTVAEQLTVAGYVDGDAKLLPTLDLGECAPTGTVGHSYQLKAWYKSTAPTQFELYYRTGLGTWLYWTASPLMNAAADWVQGSWTSPPLPTGASAVSFGLNLISNGTLTTDDYEMTDAGAVPSFTDVPASNQFYNEISWLALNNITTGYPDGTFRPVSPVNRDAMAAFLYRFKGSPAYTPPAISRFSDVPTTSQFYKEISWLAESGITTGYPDNTFRPLASVNRDAMAAFIYRMNGKPAVTGTSSFTDVAANNQFYPEITWLSQTGITTGFPDNTFHPVEPVQRDAIAAFLYRYNSLYGR
jgi:peptidoglycan/xylan/chitin deacetylase (PgdA/CDA1 family)